VVTRSRESRIVARKSRVEQYYYGAARDLSPVSQTLKLSDLGIYRVGGGPKAPASALPIGATSVTDPLKVTLVSNPRDLLYTMVAVSHAPSADLLLSVNVAGFIYVQDVDPDKGTLTYLAPCGGELPGSLLLAGSFKVYLE
jgi:polyribonucleotide 5'-hydroxyl-kinase